MNKNDIVTVTIEDMTTEGEGLGKIDGFPLFIKDTVIDDVCMVRITKLKKNYGYGRLMELLTPSTKRVEAVCPVARACGGCQLQSLSYEEQKAFKRKKVLNNMKRLGGLEVAYAEEGVEGAIPVAEVIGCDERPFRYRNKALIPVGYTKEGELVAGFYAGRTHAIIAADDCYLTPKEDQTIIACVLKWMKQYHISAYREETHTGLVRHIQIREGFATGEILVCLIINGTKLGSPAAVKSLIDSLKQCEPRIETIAYSVNLEQTNVVMGKEVVTIYGSGTIRDRIGSVVFDISPQSFYQVNPLQTERLYQKAVDLAGLTGNEVVWDLYCGIGTISLFLAQNAKQVYGVEIVPQAIEDAKKNATNNSITNAEFFVGKSEEICPAKFKENPKQYRADVVVVDPPRKGCDEALLETVLLMAPERFVYVSCDSATLARDLKWLMEHANGAYQIEEIVPVDQFPQTTHVETVCLLSKFHEAKHHVSVKLDMDEMDLTSAESKATYEEIKKYVAEHNDGMKVSSLNIAQVKAKYGMIERENFNKPKSEEAKRPQCSKEKEDAIVETLKAFQMI